MSADKYAKCPAATNNAQACPSSFIADEFADPNIMGKTVNCGWYCLRNCSPEKLMPIFLNLPKVGLFKLSGGQIRIPIDYINFEFVTSTEHIMISISRDTGKESWEWDDSEYDDNSIPYSQYLKKIGFTDEGTRFSDLANQLCKWFKRQDPDTKIQTECSAGLEDPIMMADDIANLEFVGFDRPFFRPVSEWTNNGEYVETESIVLNEPEIASEKKVAEAESDSDKIIYDLKLTTMGSNLERWRQILNKYSSPDLNKENLRKVIDWSITNDRWDVISAILTIPKYQYIFDEIGDSWKTPLVKWAKEYLDQSDRPTHYMFATDDIRLFKLFYPNNLDVPEYVVKEINNHPGAREIRLYIEKHFVYRTREQDQICNKHLLIPIKRTAEWLVVPYRRIFKKLHIFVNKGRSAEVKPIENAEILISSSSLDMGLASFLEGYKSPSVDSLLFDTNQKFIEGLSDREITVLSGYTFIGDRLVNLYLRDDPEFDTYVSKKLAKLSDSEIAPIHYQILDRFPEMSRTSSSSVNIWLREAVNSNPDFYLIIRECVGRFIDELMAIFAKAPTVKTGFSVFRGTKTFYYKSEGSNQFENIDFMSTSVNPMTAMNFADNDCCFTQFNLRAGTRIIFLEPITQVKGEVEFLLSPHQKFVMTKHRLKKFTVIPPKLTDYITDVCKNKGRTMRYTVMNGV